jgi:hypothetical protein
LEIQRKIEKAREEKNSDEMNCGRRKEEKRERDYSSPTVVMG